MSRYTMELRQLVESGYNCFDESWTTFQPEHKAELCSKILRHYWFYEIGMSTPDKFKFYLNEQLAMIMPYYNQLYESELLKVVPLFNHFVETMDDTDRKANGDLTKCNKRDTISVRQMANSLKRLDDATRNIDRNLDSTGNTKYTDSKSGDEDTSRKENTSISEITDSDTTTTGKKDVTQETTTTGKETMSDTLDGTKTTETQSTTNTTASKFYSDTPQGEVTASGVNIDKSYLTNYTHDTGNQTVNGTTTETLKNDESKTTDTTKTENSTTGEMSSGSGTEDKTVTTTKETTETINKEWSENGSGTQDEAGNEAEKQSDVSSSTSKEFSNGTTQENDTANEAEAQTRTDKESVKRKIKEQGYTISQAELLREYRKTFLNIDQMIIRELAENFMGVFT